MEFLKYTLGITGALLSLIVMYWIAVAALAIDIGKLVEAVDGTEEGQ